MELFAIKRYGETKLSQQDEQEQEDAILQRLKKKVEHRQEQTTAKVAEIEQQSDAAESEGKDKIIDSTAFDNLEADDGENHESEEAEEDLQNNEPDIVQATSDDTPLQPEEFTILGGHQVKKLSKVEKILPPWLSHPTVIDGDLSKKGKSIKKLQFIDDQIKQNLKKMGFKRLFPVQESVIPWILEAHRKPAPFWPRDVCISSPTGSGKTLAFAVPIVQILLKRIAPAVRALVILPVKELADQVYSVFEKLCEGTKVRPLLLSRKQAFSSEQAKLVNCFNGEYMAKVDIVVTTAGRLVEHLHSTSGFTLKNLRFLVIDEADRVIDQIQNDWLYHLNKHVKEESDEYLLGRASGQLSQTELFDKPRQPHKLLFSATISQDPEKLQTFRLFHPKLFSAITESAPAVNALPTQNANESEKRGKFLGQYATPLELRELICMTQYKIKPLTLFALVKENNYKRFLCFTNSIDAAHRLSFVLQKMFESQLVIEEWSSALSPAARKSVLTRFALGKVNGIICTDALARGIDIDDIEVVISYDMPRHINTYIHRIGRTGRAGNRGTSITMVIDEEVKKFNRILAEAGKAELSKIDIKSNAEEDYSVQYSTALNDLREALDLEKQTINKIRNGMSLANTTKVNLLSKLKDRVDIDTAKTSETIKSLVHLPKAWSNEAIEKRAKEDGEKKRQKKRPASDQPENSKDGIEAEQRTSKKLKSSSNPDSTETTVDS